MSPQWIYLLIGVWFYKGPSGHKTGIHSGSRALLGALGLKSSYKSFLLCLQMGVRSFCLSQLGSQLLGCNFVFPPGVNSWIIPSHQRIEAALSYLVFGKNSHGKAAVTSIGHLNSLCCTSSSLDRWGWKPWKLAAPGPGTPRSMKCNAIVENVKKTH